MLAAERDGVSAINYREATKVDISEMCSLFVSHGNSWIVLHPIQHDFRITSLKGEFINKSIGELKVDYNQYYDKQYVNVYIKTYTKITPCNAIIELIKCKEHFLDCKHLKTLTWNNFCEYMEFGMSLIKIGSKNREIKCPIMGEYVLKNITYDPTTAIPFFFAPTEKWWEYTYKLNLIAYGCLSNKLMTFYCEVYILTYRLKRKLE
ncbi:uncharacterized protein LOC126900198 isoform X2 [Daktulosphaira vitifoliae]|uniref:uncharacterized protein LOC126900198 isoform X2 n=1 Tax=Daktulosphaira vitifoliae TaxID=58002 RepID=UPI0021AAF63F|nr:uncharacterized protein LOC126900198 isoform X2 [Daktulosphaira vitifoliae]